MTTFSGRVLLPSGEARCEVQVTDGVITAIGDSVVNGAADVVLADDEVLLPGLVDTHVHVNEPGRTEWEGFASATRAAAAGGVTTIVDMPLNSIPPTVTVDALEVKRKAAAGQCFVDVGFWGGAIPGNLPSLAGLHDAGVFGFKCFLVDSGVEEFPPLNLDEVGEVMSSVAELDGLLVVHAEDAHAIGTCGPGYASFLASRPRQAEAAAIASIAELSEATGCRAHILHVSSSEALPLLGKVSAETCPHYLTFTAEEIGESATEFKCCPPIRESDNREALWEGLRSGAIGLVVSDHSPATADIKTTGDFGTAWGGIASLQLGLSAVWTGARERGFSLADVVRWMSSAPAALVGLSRKGAIEVGRDADLVVFAPDDAFTVAGADLHHRNPVTPYDGMTLSGVVRSTWLRGARVDVNGGPHGRLLSR
jgi:allantoinase